MRTPTPTPSGGPIQWLSDKEGQLNMFDFIADFKPTKPSGKGEKKR